MQLRCRLAALALPALSIALLVAPGVTRAADLPGRELPAEVPVAEVLIEGNARVETATIRALLVTAPGTLLDVATVGADVRRVFALGFFDEVAIELTEDPARVVVVVRVREKPLVRAVEIRGNDALSDEKLAEVVDVKRAASSSTCRSSAAASRSSARSTRARASSRPT